MKFLKIEAIYRKTDNSWWPPKMIDFTQSLTLKYTTNHEVIWDKKDGRAHCSAGSKIFGQHYSS